MGGMRSAFSAFFMPSHLLRPLQALHEDLPQAEASEADKGHVGLFVLNYAARRVKCVRSRRVAVVGRTSPVELKASPPLARAPHLLRMSPTSSLPDPA